MGLNIGFSLHRPSIWGVSLPSEEPQNVYVLHTPVSQSSLLSAGIHWSQKAQIHIGKLNIFGRKRSRPKTSSWFGGYRYFYTCHLHTSFPCESSFTTMKSISPRLTALQFPLEDPAKITELSSPAAAAAALNDSFRPVPSCRVTGNIAIRST